MTDKTSETPNLEKLLKSIEWSGYNSGWECCPSCYGYQHEGHTETCELAAAIQEAGKPYTHKQRHIELHNSLYELAADYLTHTKNRPSKTTVLELMEWSHQQTINPTE